MYEDKIKTLIDKLLHEDTTNDEISYTTKELKRFDEHVAECLLKHLYVTKPNPRVIKAFEKFDENVAVYIIKDMLNNDPVSNLYQNEKKILDVMGQTAILPQIRYICLFGDGDPDVKDDFVEILSKQKNVLPLLTKFIYNNDHDIDYFDKYHYCSQIYVNQGFFAVKHLLDSLNQYDWSNENKQIIENIISEIGEDAVIPLKDYLKCNYEIKIFAARLLDKINNTSIESAIRAMYGNVNFQYLSTLFGPDDMSWNEFEMLVMNLYEHYGYRVEKTEYNDFGADLIAMYPGHDRVAVQVKQTRDTTKINAVQEVVSAKNFYFCSRAEVVSSNYFSKSAKQLAWSNDVTLINKDDLKNLISRCNA